MILDGDPLADITNTANIHAVLVRGRLIDSAERRRRFADVEDAAKETSSSMAPGCVCHMPAQNTEVRSATGSA